MSGGSCYPLAVPLLCVVGARGHGYAKAGEASKGNAPFPPKPDPRLDVPGAFPLLLTRISSKPRLPVPFCQLKDSASRRDKGFCIPLGLNPRYQGVWGHVALQEAKSWLSAEG